MTKKSTEDSNIPAIQSTINDYAIVKMDADIGEIMSANMDSENISMANFTRITVPTGGTTMWTYEMNGEETASKTIEGIIVHVTQTRAYWATELAGTGTPPDCVSETCISGTGNPGGACKTCPFAQFGSARGGAGRGQACQIKKNLFVLLPNTIFPVIIAAPSMSLSAVSQYLFGLTNALKVRHNVITSFGLEKDKNKDGKDFARLTLKAIGTITDASEKLAIQKYMEGFRAMMATQSEPIAVKPTAVNETTNHKSASDVAQEDDFAKFEDQNKDSSGQKQTHIPF